MSHRTIAGDLNGPAQRRHRTTATRRPGMSPVLHAAILLLLLSVLAPSVLGATVPADGEHPVCDTRCCTVQPNCSAALHVTCRCDDQAQIALRRGDLPASVETITIERVGRLEIHQNALLDLSSLTMVKLRGIGNVTVQSNGLAPRRGASLRSASISVVGSMELGRRALSGFWAETAILEIGHISRFDINQNAFWFPSPFQVPSLTINSIGALEIAANAFNAPFGKLTLRAVAMELCSENAFGGSLHSIDIEEASVGEVGEGCITGSGSLQRLSIASSRLGVIRSRGIAGSISSVTIRNSNITTLQPNGVQLRVKNFTVADSAFSEIMTTGFDVGADGSIYFNRTNVTTLRKRAFIHLKAAADEIKNRPHVYMDRLSVSRADNGSLAFDNATAVQLVRLSVRVPEPAVCPVDRWVRQLTGAGETDPLDDTQRLILKMLQRDWLCRPDQPAPSAAPDADSEDSGAPGADRGAPGVDRGGLGADRGDPGVERGDPGADRGGLGADRGAPGTDRGDPVPTARIPATDDRSWDYRSPIIAVVAAGLVIAIIVACRRKCGRSIGTGTDHQEEQHQESDAGRYTFVPQQSETIPVELQPEDESQGMPTDGVSLIIGADSVRRRVALKPRERDEMMR